MPRIGTKGQAGHRPLKLTATNLSFIYWNAILILLSQDTMIIRPFNQPYNASAITRQVLSGLRPVRSTCWQKRLFKASAQRRLAVAEMKHEDLAGLRINQDRLMNDIHSTSEWGKGERWGE